MTAKRPFFRYKGINWTACNWTRLSLSLFIGENVKIWISRTVASTQFLDSWDISFTGYEQSELCKVCCTCFWHCWQYGSHTLRTVSLSHYQDWSSVFFGEGLRNAVFVWQFFRIQLTCISGVWLHWKGCWTSRTIHLPRRSVESTHCQQNKFFLNISFLGNFAVNQHLQISYWFIGRLPDIFHR